MSVNDRIMPVIRAELRRAIKGTLDVIEGAPVLKALDGYSLGATNDEERLLVRRLHELRSCVAFARAAGVPIPHVEANYESGPTVLQAHTLRDTDTL